MVDQTILLLEKRIAEAENLTDKQKGLLLLKLISTIRENCKCGDVTYGVSETNKKIRCRRNAEMAAEFKDILEDLMLKANGGNRGQSSQTVEQWSENMSDGNYNLLTEYEKQQLIRSIYYDKLNRSRFMHTRNE